MDASRYQAAKRSMAKNIGRQDLTSRDVAVGVGYSRILLPYGRLQRYTIRWDWTGGGRT